MGMPFVRTLQYLGFESVSRTTFPPALSLPLSLPPLNDIFKVRQRIQNVAINFTVGFARGSRGSVPQRLSDKATLCLKREFFLWVSVQPKVRTFVFRREWCPNIRYAQSMYSVVPLARRGAALLRRAGRVDPAFLSAFIARELRLSLSLSLCVGTTPI